mmetsp:Transcript_9751/g.21687  ORF Transcript_9751/g.21687 Transcript_9751/m.21687 type:complete len:233 (+) Transcript_9751:379-1077(+)
MPRRPGLQGASGRVLRQLFDWRPGGAAGQHVLLAHRAGQGLHFPGSAHLRDDHRVRARSQGLHRDHAAAAQIRHLPAAGSAGARGRHGGAGGERTAGERAAAPGTCPTARSAIRHCVQSGARQSGRAEVRLLRRAGPAQPAHQRRGERVGAQARCCGARALPGRLLRFAGAQHKLLAPALRAGAHAAGPVRLSGGSARARLAQRQRLRDRGARVQVPCTDRQAAAQDDGCEI